MDNITLTVIYEGQALNRNEKIAGNITSIKKLHFLNEEFSYISKYAIRHYLFTTLNSAYKEDWKETSVTSRNDVIQFDISKDDIFTSAELDAFGYMYTIKGETSITRKSPLGITKAISLIPYRGDMQFNANHELVRRAREQGEDASPNIFQSQENMTFYKVSFTFDTKFFGIDEWIVDDYKFDKQKGLLEVEINIKDKDKDKNKDEDKDKDQKKSGEQQKFLKTFRCVEKSDNENEKFEVYACDKNGNAVEGSKGQKIGEISFHSINGNKKKMIMKLEEKIKKKRIYQILEAIKDGFVAHSSSEDNTLIPLFIIASHVKVPSPVFHPYIHIDLSEDKPKVIGLRDCYQNSWIRDMGKVYVYISERLKADLSDFKDKTLDSWDEFIKPYTDIDEKSSELNKSEKQCYDEDTKN
ncbi:MAG: type I-B CRISPR-associated protein Cas7/Cst2/DevR [Candidatus Aenigmatarchaeota archaeon]